jgi:feruloyl esterase
MEFRHSLSDRGAVARTAAVTLLALGAYSLQQDQAVAQTAKAKPASATCSVESIQRMAPPDTKIASAAPTAAPVPHCLIDGYITTTDPGPNQVNFRLQLPDSGWTGRYYFIGLGGTAGYVPTNSQIPAGNPLVKGFAVAGTDTGHQYGGGDWSFLGREKAKAVDHIHRGAHVTALATQQITKKYYDVDKIYRYHSGCSGGGRMGMEVITRHPEDYDGVLLGAPGIGPERGSETMMAFIHTAQQMTREPGAWLSPDKLKMLEAKVTDKCDAIDGAKDGVIWQHEKCSFDFKQLKCPSGDGPNCLTEPEIKSVESLLEGPRGPKGPIKHGLPISNMSTWSVFIGPPPPWPREFTEENRQRISPAFRMGTTTAQSYFSPEFDILKDFDFKDQKRIDAWWESAKRIGYGYKFPTDLTGLKKNGGKVIFWNGVSDSCCIDLELLKYYKDSSASVGGMSEMNKIAKFYRIPGMAHCGGGTGPQDTPDKLLEAMIDWVEKGKAPDAVVAHRGDRAKPLFADPTTGTVSGVVVPPATGEPRDFLLCPYPQVAKFNGKQGGEFEAANWSCRPG